MAQPRFALLVHAGAVDLGVFTRREPHCWAALLARPARVRQRARVRLGNALGLVEVLELACLHLAASSYAEDPRHAAVDVGFPVGADLVSVGANSPVCPGILPGRAGLGRRQVAHDLGRRLRLARSGRRRRRRRGRRHAGRPVRRADAVGQSRVGAEHRRHHTGQRVFHGQVLARAVEVRERGRMRHHEIVVGDGARVARAEQRRVERRRLPRHAVHGRLHHETARRRRPRRRLLVVVDHRRQHRVDRARPAQRVAPCLEARDEHGLEAAHRLDGLELLARGEEVDRRLPVARALDQGKRAVQVARREAAGAPAAPEVVVGRRRRARQVRRLGGESLLSDDVRHRRRPMRPQARVDQRDDRTVARRRLAPLQRVQEHHVADATVRHDRKDRVAWWRPIADLRCDQRGEAAKLSVGDHLDVRVRVELRVAQRRAARDAPCGIVRR